MAYYGTVGSTLLGHLTHRPVVGLGGGAAHPHQESRGVTLHIHDAADLDEAVRSGVVSFLLPDWTGPNRLALRISAGQDSGIDNVATTTLALMELMRADGVGATAMLDGVGGMYLAGVGADRSEAGRYARELADRSPEIATTSDADAAGRALITPLPPAGDGMPAPYSLVDGPHGLAVIAPLTGDEVAAATAGMPLDIEMADMADRLRSRGDLALQLAQPSTPDA
jgi:hypothetical protein